MTSPLDLASPGTGTAPPPSAPAAVDATTSDPQQPRKLQDVLADFDLDTEDGKQILEVRRKYKQKWSIIRMDRVRKCSRNLEYIKGNQYIVYQDGRWFSPFEESSGITGSEQGEDESFYKYINNVTQWCHRVYSAALGGEAPKTRFWPSDADRTEDMTAAEEAGKAQAKIERDNKLLSLQKQELLYFFTGGCYGKYTRWLRDEDRAGVHDEPVYVQANQQVFGDRYICPTCGEDNQQQQQVPGTNVTQKCTECGSDLGEGDFFPSESAEGVTEQGMKEVPNGLVASSVYNTLQVDLDPRAGDATRSAVAMSAILDLEDEADVAALRAMYPEAWDDLKQSKGSSDGNGDMDYSRTARNKVFASTIRRNLQGLDELPTLSRCWIQSWAFNILDDRKRAEKLKKAFPKGCLCISVPASEKILDLRSERATDHWTWGVTQIGFGAYPPAPCDSAIDFQDRINDVGNDIHNYIDRLSTPDVLANTNLVDIKALNSNATGAGGFKGIKPKQAMNGQIQQGLESAFFQPELHTDAKIFEYAQELWLALQICLGITPQMFGGSDPNIKTKGGQEQALNTSRGILAPYWDQLREEHAASAIVGVKCMAENATEDVLDVITGGGSGFKNQFVRVDALQGNFSAWPEPDQGYPTTFAERQDVIKEMILNAAKNPIIQEMLGPRVNQRLAAMHLLPSGFEIPGTFAEDKCKKDIDQLIAPGVGPMMMPNPATGQLIPMPSIQPDKDVDDLQISEQVATDWMLKNFYTTRMENPNGFENVRLYLKLVVQLNAQKQTQQQMTGVVAPTSQAGTTQA
jgi:hypothetical protein